MVKIPPPSSPLAANRAHDWFNESRFGLFIHWGAYSAAARGEWVANREQFGKTEYAEKIASKFGAEHYDPDAWAALAREAGAGYVVLTARHHDGFALWPTETSDFHAGRLGPKRDLVKPFVEAIRRAGLRVGLYFSPADWFHPDYPGAFFRDWPGPGDWRDEESRLRFIAYYRAQLRELLTWYGTIDYLWFDGCLPANLRDSLANEEALRLQPSLLINERNGLPSHVRISEQAIVAAPTGALWEACLTLNDSWGYHAGDTNWKSPLRVIQMLTETAAGAGNLLLNLGPTGAGTVPEASRIILGEVGAWLRRNGDSIHNSQRSEFGWFHSGRMTVGSNRIYVHLWHGTGRELRLSNIKNLIVLACVLADQSPIPFRQEGSRLVLEIPDPLPDHLVTTLALDTAGPPEPMVAPTTFWIPGTDP